jgi:hypothetical protein
LALAAARVSGNHTKGDNTMLALLLVLLLIVLLFGGGFAWSVLWFIAAAVLILWLIGFVVRGAEGARWYRW